MKRRMLPLLALLLCLECTAAAAAPSYADTDTYYTNPQGTIQAVRDILYTSGSFDSPSSTGIFGAPDTLSEENSPTPAYFLYWTPISHLYKVTDAVTWDIHDGVLTFRGTGDGLFPGVDVNPFKGHRHIRTAVVDGGITALGFEFADISELQTVILLDYDTYVVSKAPCTIYGADLRKDRMRIQYYDNGDYTFIQYSAAEREQFIRDVKAILANSSMNDTAWAMLPDEFGGPADTAKAVPSVQSVLVDGKQIEFDMYALTDPNGSTTNYIRVRDLAAILNGTAAQFEVGWNGSVLLTGKAPYTGSRDKAPFNTPMAYTACTEPTYINGRAAEPDAIRITYNGGGYTYYKLRDLGRALGFNVGWSSAGIFVETDKPYDPNN